MKMTIKPKKLFNRTVQYITLLFIVGTIILGITVQYWLLIILILLIPIPLTLFLIDYSRRKALIELDDEQIILYHCAVKEVTWRIKYHEHILVNCADITEATVVNFGTGRNELIILQLTLTDGDPIMVNADLFQGKTIDALQQQLCGGEQIETESAHKFNIRQWIWIGLALIVAILYTLFFHRTTWHTEKAEDQDLAVITNSTQHAITLQMQQRDSLSTPLTLTIAPQQTVTFQELFIPSTLRTNKFAINQIRNVPRGYIRDTLYVVFDDSIRIMQQCIYDTTTDSLHYLPEKCFLDHQNWMVNDMFVKTEHHISGSRYNRRYSANEVYRYRITYTFDETDYETALRATNR